jgi:hypothetical protein
MPDRGADMGDLGHWDATSEVVVLRATREGNSEALHLTRATAEERAEELRAEGWSVEIIEPKRSHD